MARHALILVAVLVVAACGPDATPAVSPTPTLYTITRPTPGSPVPAGSVVVVPAPATPAAGPPDLILRDASVVTMDTARPAAQAIAVRGDRILAVGTNDEIAALAGPNTAVVSLRGRTVTPGFIDAHQHRIANGPAALGVDVKSLVDAAIRQGYTGLGELANDDGKIADLRRLDQAGILRLRVDAYLMVQENSPAGRLLGGYFNTYTPGQAIGPHVRIAGLKVFTDFDNAKILLWKQDDLTAFLLEQYRKGWPLAVKTVSTRSLDMILTSLRSVAAAEPRLVDARVRLEHELFATAAQIATIKELGLVPVVNLNMPGQGVGDADVSELVAREPGGSYVPWRSIVGAGIPLAAMSGFPSYYVNEPTGAPFGSPMHLIYQGVTRAGNLGTRSPPQLLDQAITADAALRALTINAARAARTDDVRGSVSAGKLADLVVLSADPRAVPPEEINAIGVLMTMIGGKAEFCSGDVAATVPGCRP